MCILLLRNNIQAWGVTNFEKTIVTYERNRADPTKVFIFDGKDMILVDYSEFRQQQKNFYTSAFKFIKREDNKTLEQSHTDIVQDAKTLRQETNGLINMFKSGYHPMTALTLFNHFNTECIPEQITEDEAEWIDKATFGASVYSTPYEGQAFKYDICSMYPSIMKNNNMLFPFKAGEFKHLDKFDIDYSVAIYRCYISDYDTRLFKGNCFHYYTTQDVRRARELKAKIELIIDDKPNVLIYDRQKCKTGAQIFGKFVKYMFELKQRKVPRAKQILNCLWGVLSGKNIINMIIDENEPLVEVNNKKILSIQSLGGDKSMVQLLPETGLYEYNWARIAPFILAKGRFMISKIMEPYIDDIVRVHTDGFISIKLLPLQTGTDIGELKYEGFCKDAKIENIIKTYGEYTV